ncbi:MAG: IS5 family transposase [Proteobacteria bacterium]|nr:IS5 family transposase [Pseudomonadota bacterium]
MTAKKHRPTPGFFDADELLARVAQTDHVLFRIDKLVEWERFRPILDEVFKIVPKKPGGRPPYDRMMMFKVMVIKHLYNIPDGQMEIRLLGDLHYRVFLGLSMADATPDENTIWLFHNKLCQSGVILELFDAFDAQLLQQGLVAQEGRSVDATIVPVPIQRVTKKERETIKRGDTPEEWKQNPAILRQRDTDAAWTKKHGKSYFGYKNHIKMDEKKKLIRTFEVTPANVHDSQPVGILLNEEDTGQPLYGDAAYVGDPIRQMLRGLKMKDCRHAKATKNEPLSRYQKRANKAKSKIRARVEHVFGAMRMKMGDIRIRSIGVARVTFVIGMRNILYNMCRADFLRRMQIRTA